MAGGERLFGRGRTEGVHGGDEGYDGRKDGQFLGLEVWPESHWPGFALRQADVLQLYTA